MGSLRDQLLAAGLVSARDRQRVERELKEERRQRQGRCEARASVEARQEATRCAREEEERRLRLAERQARRSAEEAAARDLQVTHLLCHHALRSTGGPQRFWHRTVDGTHCHRLDLSERTAFDVRAGRAGIGALPLHGDVDYVVVAREIVQRVRAALPGRIVFWNETAPPEDDPSERLWEPDEVRARPGPTRGPGAR